MSRLKKLREKTGCGMMMCKQAIEYAKGDEQVAIAYLKARTLAVATHGLTFDQRIQSFIKTTEE